MLLLCLHERIRQLDVAEEGLDDSAVFGEEEGECDLGREQPQVEKSEEKTARLAGGRLQLGAKEDEDLGDESDGADTGADDGGDYA